MRAAIYARVSTERQERQQTITSQLAALQAWAEAAGHDLSERHVFRDEGYSGSRLDRPGLDALRDAVRDGEVDVVAVVSPDRLARKYAYQALLLEEIRRAGCAIEFLNHAIGDNPGDQLLLQIQGAVAEYERALLSERFRRGKLQKARAGQFIGVRAPYGYHSTGRSLNGAGRLVINEAEAELVRLLYGWLIDEQLSIRQILRRLNFGPWFPRSGRRPWSPSVVQHILSDPVYVGTAYANRYEYVAAKKPRSVRKPSYSGKGCRKLRPKEQWIPIPVPAIISPDRWDHAQAQLARNAALSFRNNQKHNHLLRCLLTCGACGLAMHGVMRRTSAGGEHRYYRCAGKDCVHTARATPCPRAQVDGSHLERVVWDHILTLLVEPEQLLAQYERFASGADPASRREQASEQQLQARLDRLARTNCRLLDAYQAEAISLDELRERRAQLAEQRLALEQQQIQQQKLRSEQVRAQAVLADLSAFCQRIRGRLDDASFADKQAVLQLIIERIIVHESSLEIRHVIPLRNPPSGGSCPIGTPNGRLRSDRVHIATLPRRLGQDLADRRLQAGMVVGDDKLYAMQATLPQRQQEVTPTGAAFTVSQLHSQNLSSPLTIHRNQHRLTGDDATLAHPLVARIQDQIRIRLTQPPVGKRAQRLIQALVDLADRGGRELMAT